MTAADQRPSVLMIAPGPFFVDRGFGVAVYEQARALRRRGIRVEVVCYSSGRDMVDVPIHRALAFPGYDATKTGPSLARLPLWALLLFKTLQVAARTRPDLLHGHLHEGGLIAYVVSRLVGTPWLLDHHGSLSLELAEKNFLREGSLPFRLASLVERGIDRLAPRILVKSTEMQQAVGNRFQVEPSRIVCSMDGADPDTFSPRPADPELRTRLGIEPEAVVIGYLGLLTVQQGAERLFRSAAEVLAAHPECHFLVIGYPVDLAKELAQKLEISPRVTLTGRLDHAIAADHLALADLAVAPKVSTAEGNLKIYHYMGMALPVVAIDSPGNRESLCDDGYYVRGENAEEFAQGIIHALETRDEWEARGRRLRRRLEEQFTWAAVASRTLAAYRAVAPSAFAGLTD